MGWLSWIRDKTKKQVDSFGNQYLLFGIFGVLNYPIFYIIWVYLSYQSYENLGLRLGATLLSIPLIFHKKLYKLIGDWIALYWYFTLTFCLPFFFTFMLLKNDATDVWLMSTTIVMVWLMLLVDSVTFVVLLAIGTGLGILIFHLTPHMFFYKKDLTGLIYQYFGSLAVVLVFARQKDRRYERNLRLKAEISDKAKTEFIANMSHDLKTPMQGFLGMLEGILKTEEDARTSLNSKSHLNQEKLEKVLTHVLDQMKEYADMALISGKRLNQFHDDVLNNVELDSGQNKESVTDFNLDHLIQDVIGLQRAAAFNKKLNLTAEIEEHTPCYLNGFRQSFYRILVNLISNSIKFTKEGSITINVSLNKSNDSDLCHAGDKIMLKVRVSDTGVGIPHDKFDEIFNQFSRLTSSYKGIYKGLGMGLYAVKKYVNEMKGEIRVESKVNEGSHFTVYLPFNVEKEGETQFEDSRKMPKKSGLDKKFELDKGLESDSEKTDESKKLVLLVEDDKIAAMTVRMSLTNLGCEIDWAESGEEAIEKLGQKNYKLIIMDIGLPGMTGIETAAAIRRLKDKNKANTPIVALTGHAYGKSRQLCLNAGMQSVYGKPATPEDLKKALDYFSAK